MLIIQRIGRQIRQGQTTPYICESSCGTKYVVKGPKTTYKGLINEWVCAGLGKELGLPIPEYDVAYIDQSLLAYGATELEPGEWFATKYIDNIQDVPFALLDTVNKNLLKRLFIFDYWIENGDRSLTHHGGNPNFFYNPSNSCFFVLDHNLAFDPDYEKNFKATISTHLGYSSWYQAQPDFLDMEYHREELERVWGKVDQIFQGIPAHWLDETYDTGILDYIKLRLQRFQQDNFWEGLK